MAGAHGPPHSPPRLVHIPSPPRCIARAPQVMETFISEPTLDWQLAARRKQADGGGGVERATSEDADAVAAAQESSGAWYPRTKVLVADLKLRRANPGPLMLLELLQNSYVLPRRSAAVADEKCALLLGGLRTAVLGLHRSRERPRQAPANLRELRLAPVERLLLEGALGGPLRCGGPSVRLDVALAVCASAEQQAACLIDMAGDPGTLVRAYAGLATWV